MQDAVATERIEDLKQKPLASKTTEAVTQEKNAYLRSLHPRKALEGLATGTKRIVKKAGFMVAPAIIALLPVAADRSDTEIAVAQTAALGATGAAAGVAVAGSAENAIGKKISKKAKVAAAATGAAALYAAGHGANELGGSIMRGGVTIIDEPLVIGTALVTEAGVKKVAEKRNKPKGAKVSESKPIPEDARVKA